LEGHAQRELLQTEAPLFWCGVQKFGGECRNPAKPDGDQREPARPNYFYEHYMEETAKNRYERRKYKILSKIP
jgi:hypothetical protein